MREDDDDRPKPKSLVLKPNLDPLSVGQLQKRPLQRLLAQGHVHDVLGRGAIGREQVAERGVLPFAQRPVEGRDRARGVAQRE